MGRTMSVTDPYFKACIYINFKEGISLDSFKSTLKMQEMAFQTFILSIQKFSKKKVYIYIYIINLTTRVYLNF